EARADPRGADRAVRARRALRRRARDRPGAFPGPVRRERCSRAGAHAMAPGAGIDRAACGHRLAQRGGGREHGGDDRGVRRLPVSLLSRNRRRAPPGAGRAAGARAPRVASLSPGRHPSPRVCGGGRVRVRGRAGAGPADARRIVRRPGGDRKAAVEGVRQGSGRSRFRAVPGMPRRARRSGPRPRRRRDGAGARPQGHTDAGDRPHPAVRHPGGRLHPGPRAERALLASTLGPGTM
ncbi:MAG: hypothetical protein AVDCRST_MAG68-4877, partial [uncultured Gemmatimonadetes bacterium]